MEEAWAVLARLERIETLQRRGAAPAPLLLELQELAREAEAWAKRERDPRAREAAEALVLCALPAAASSSDSTSTPARR